MDYVIKILISLKQQPPTRDRLREVVEKARVGDLEGAFQAYSFIQHETPDDVTKKVIKRIYETHRGKNA